jgi:thiamine pyrophosphokinase
VEGFLMTRAIIFANGELNPPLPTPAYFRPDDLLIAADGGVHHYAKLGITPHILIGDFDSLKPEEIEALQSAGVQINRYPADKDETDLELALLYAIHQGAGQIVVFGALGARWDMTLANLMLLANSAFKYTWLSLVDGNQEISLLRGGQSIHLHGKQGDTISLIPLSSEASGITTQYLEYPLLDGAITIGSPRGVSNVMLREKCQVTLGKGLLAVVHIRQVP